MATQEELQKKIDTLERSLAGFRGRAEATGARGLEARQKLDALYRELIPVLAAELAAKQKQFDESESFPERASLRGDIPTLSFP